MLNYLPFLVISALSNTMLDAHDTAQQRTCSFSRYYEFLIDTHVVYLDSLQSPSIAFDGTNYLLVLADFRGASWDIYGARVNQQGFVVDTTSIAICTDTNKQLSPTVSFDGTNYFIAWQDWRSDTSCDIYGARVSQSGRVLDSMSIAISTAFGKQMTPSVVFGETNYLVVWRDYRSDVYGDIYGARINLDGTLLDTLGIAICIAPWDQENPAVAFDGLNYMVIWQDWRTGCRGLIYGGLVTQTGSVLDTTGTFIFNAHAWYPPSIVFDGTNYFVAWGGGHEFHDIYGGRVNPQCVALDTMGFPISTAFGYQFNPSVSFDGTNYLVTWEDQRNGYYISDVYGARVNQQGSVLDTLGIPFSTAAGNQISPSIAFDGSNYLAIWKDLRNGPIGDIYATRVNQQGIVIDTTGIVVFSDPYDYAQYHPAVAFDGTNYFAVWEDERNKPMFNYDIYGARIDSAGVILDSACIPISIALNNQSHAAAAFSESNYIVAWTDCRNNSFDIYGARISTSGVVLDSFGIALSTYSNYQTLPSIASREANSFVVWQDERNISADIYGTRVDTAGIVLDSTGIPISTTLDNEFSPSIAFDGSNYLVVWQVYEGCQVYESCLGYNVYGARIDTSGIVLDTAGIGISIARFDQRNPTIAFDGVNYLVVWQDMCNSVNYDIYGARVDTSGVVLDTLAIPITTAANNQEFPAVCFDGSNYLVVWQDHRYGSSWQIYGARVSPFGVVLEEFPITYQFGNQISPALACGYNGQILIMWSGWIDFINGHPANTMRIWGKFYPFTSIKERPGYQVLDIEYALEVYPNPFHESLNLKFQIPNLIQTIHPTSQTTIKIYDATGRLVKDLTGLMVNSTESQITWDGIDYLGRKIPEGVYFVHIKHGDYQEAKKIISLR